VVQLVSEISDSEGEYLVRLARETIEKYIIDNKKNEIPRDIPNKYKQKSGVFVTINKKSNGGKDLRGCIGLPYPDKPLIEALIDASISASTEDPRFEPLITNELDKIIIEVSVLTTPEIIAVNSPKDYPSRIKIGEDGLIIRWKYGSGLLLPQVPVEYKWSPEEYLSQACMKAGATPDLWLTEDCKIYVFHAIVFGESLPRGKIKRIYLE
jgi:uncharacterized protein (TIGR00296 family)